jgi:hypothetical protein
MRIRIKRAYAMAGLAVAGAGFTVLAGAGPVALAGSPAVDVTPNPTAPNTSTTFAVFCGATAGSATLFGTTLGLPEQIPMQAGTHPGEFVVTVTMPNSLSPGSYSPDIDCSNGVSATASVTVSSMPAQAPQTGDGTTSTTTNGVLTDVGLGILGIGAALGFVQLRRRAARRRA